jgi:hypothetical protein
MSKMDRDETFEDIWEDLLRAMRRQALETPEQKADRFERIARYLGQTEVEVQSLRNAVLDRLN